MDTVLGRMSEGKTVMEISSHFDMTNFKRDLERWLEILNFYPGNVKEMWNISTPTCPARSGPHLEQGSK